MKSGFIAVVVFGVLAAAAAPASAQPRRGRGRNLEAGRNGWVMSLDRGRSLARQAGKPLMVVLRCVP
jgi:hypothetical protein